MKHLFSFKMLFLIFPLLTTLPDDAFGQDTALTAIRIIGKIMDEDGAALPMANLMLFRTSDSSLIRTSLSDSDGHFRFENIKKQDCYLLAQVLGFEDAYLTIHWMNSANGQVVIPGFRMKKKEKILKAVVIAARPPLVIQKAGKLIVNVESSLLSQGKNALDILQMSPGLSIDDKGNIYIKGRAGITVLINGKPTYLSGTQLTSMLKGMSAEAISRLEIISNPSAKYDAAGSGGIIDIKLKKNEKNGFNGNGYLGYDQARYSQWRGGISMNYRSGKIGVYGSYNGAKEPYWTTSSITSDFYDSNDHLLSVLNRNASGRFDSWRNNMQTGMTWSVDSRNTIDLNFRGLWNTSRSLGTLSRDDFQNAAGSLDSFSTSLNKGSSEFHSAHWELNYRLAIDSNGKEFSASGDYSTFSIPDDQNYYTQSLNADGTAQRPADERRTHQPISITIRSVKADLTLPLKNSAKFEAGIKSAKASNDNIVGYEVLQNGAWQTDLGLSNHFIYDETINAAYVNYSRDFSKKWSLEAGVRGEQTVSTSNQVTTDSIVHRNYFQLFPSIAVQKDWGNTHSLSLSYSRRLDRPAYQDLNPFSLFIDAFNYQTGNPFLQPQFTNTLSATYIFKGRLVTSVSYSHAGNVITNTIRQNPTTHITYQSFANLDRMSHWDMNISMPWQVTKWWNTNIAFTVFYNVYEGSLDNGQLHQGRYSCNGNTMNVFTLPWKIAAELSGFYQSAQQSGPFVTAPVISFSCGVKRAFYNDRINVRLAMNDIFNTWKSGSHARYGQIDTKYTNRWMSQKFNVTLNFNFGNSKLKAPRKVNGISDEQGRIKHN